MSRKNHERNFFDSRPPPNRANGAVEGSLLQVYLDLVEATTGLKASFHDLSGITHMVPSLRLSQAHSSHYTSFCEACKSSGYGFRACVRNKYVSNYLAWKRKRPFVGVCHMGVTDLVWPCLMGDRLLGILYLGAVRDPAIAAEAAQRIRREAKALRLCSRLLMKEYARLGVLSPGAMDKAGPYLQACTTVIRNALNAAGITADMLPSIEPRRFRISRQQPHWLLASALEFIRGNYQRELSLSLLAQHLHVRPQYLSRLFSQEQGLPLTEYLHRYRVEQAKLLFQAGQTCVTTVGMDVGFNDPSYFSRVFSKVVGLSPRQFINRQQSKRGSAQIHPSSAAQS